MLSEQCPPGPSALEYFHNLQNLCLENLSEIFLINQLLNIVTQDHDNLCLVTSTLRLIGV